jgi:hypothetical protein
LDSGEVRSIVEISWSQNFVFDICFQK